MPQSSVWPHSGSSVLLWEAPGSNYPYSAVLSGVKAVDTSAENVSKDLSNGDTSNVASYINAISSALKSKETTENGSKITGIISSVSSIVGQLKEVRQRQADEAKRKEIDQYIAQLELQVEEAERKLSELRKKTWIKIGLVSLGCVALGAAAYVAFKK